jgi:hypothetical protein
VPGPKSPLEVVLTEKERDELERIERSTKTGAGLVRRAQIVLMVAEGKGVTETARAVRVNRRIVRYWVKRFNKERLDGLKDKEGRGRKPVFSPRGGDATG